MQAWARAHAAAVLDRQEARYRGDKRFVYDADVAERAVAFFARHLRHSIGELAGQPFVLEDWQARAVRLIYGWRWKATRRRVIRTVYLFVARKNGKSTFCAGLALLGLVGDGEKGAQVYSAAADKDQARIVFGEAVSMIGQSPTLGRDTQVFKEAVYCPPLNAVYRVLSKVAEKQHGLNPSRILFDELHTQTSRDLYDVLRTAVGARAEPLEVYITTAGYDRHSICWEVHGKATDVRDGVIDDPTFLPLIFETGPDDDWQDPRTWAKANPSLGAAVTLEYLKGMAADARSPARENVFRRLHLNQWTEQATRWLAGADWDACAHPVDVQALRNRRCFAGLDLASTADIAALVLLFPPRAPGERFAVLPRFFCPAETVRKRTRSDRVPYEDWVGQGLIAATPGNVIDYAAIKAQILADAQDFDLAEVAFDRWNSSQLVTELLDEGIAMVGFGQGYGSMAAPTKHLEKLVVGGELAHGGHPVLRWMSRNVSVKQDPAGNLKPDREASKEKIDGMVGLIMALGRFIAGEAEPPLAMPEGYEVAVA